MFEIDVNIIELNADLQSELDKLRRSHSKLQSENDRLTAVTSDEICDGLSEATIRKLEYDDAKNDMNKAYKFNHTYDGSPGESALQFRRQILLFDKKARQKLGRLYREHKVVDAIREAMTGNALQAVSEDIPQLIVSVSELLKCVI